MKACTKCKIDKDIKEFHFVNKEKGYLDSWCKDCKNGYTKIYNRNHKEKAKTHNKKYCSQPDIKLKYRKQHLLKSYGMSLEEFDQKEKDQCGRCAICGQEQTKGISKFLHVDHDHVSGKVRALLCSDCNQMLGRAKESPEILESGAKYLRSFK